MTTLPPPTACGVSRGQIPALVQDAVKAYLPTIKLARHSYGDKDLDSDQINPPSFVVQVQGGSRQTLARQQRRGAGSDRSAYTFTNFVVQVCTRRRVTNAAADSVRHQEWVDAVTRGVMSTVIDKTVILYENTQPPALLVGGQMLCTDITFQIRHFLPLE